VDALSKALSSHRLRVSRGAPGSSRRRSTILKEVLVCRALGAVAVAACVLPLLTSCGSSPQSVVSVDVVSAGHDPVRQATVSVRGTSVTATTNQPGTTSLIGLGPGAYTLTTSARGYFTTQTRVRVPPGKNVVVTLTYRPPLGTFVFQLGAGSTGEYWDQATITKSGVRATEYDWTCTKNPRTGKEVGTWIKFAGAVPHAIAPNTIAPDWVRRRFPTSGPPVPRSGCIT
jgi:hypothetical protein